MQFIGQLADGQSRLEVASGSDPSGEPCGDIGMDGSCFVARQPLFRFDHVGRLLLGGHLLLEGLLDLLVEEQIVHVGAVEVDVEGHRRENPQEDIAVGQEGQHAAAHAEDDGPVGEDREPADVGGDVVRVGVVEKTYGTAVGADKSTGQPQSVAHEPDGHEGESRHLGRALGQSQQDDAREEGEESPRCQMEP